MKRLCFFGMCLVAGGAAWGQAPVVHRVEHIVQPLWQAQVPEAFAKTSAELTKGEKVIAAYKLPVRLMANRAPWKALATLELYGRRIADAVKVSRPLPEVLVAELESELQPPGRISVVMSNIVYQPGFVSEIRALKEVVAAADSFRNNALRKLTPEERKAMFARAGELVKEFGPQEELNAQTEPALKADKEFVEAAWTKIEWNDLEAAADVFTDLAYGRSPVRTIGPTGGSFLDDLKRTCSKALLHDSKVPGVTGKVVYEEKLPQGWLIVGGPGPNTYDIKEPVALIVDLGGNDTYRGRVGASFDADHGNSVVIDLAGDDTYDCGPLGLATGCLGCGMVFDLGGNDTYRMKEGCGGVGLAGIGVLADRAGNDSYIGTQYALGVGIAGIGLLLDEGGSDSYTCEMFGIGLGGPCGVGAVVDLSGNDKYRCGFVQPSGYNETDAPKGKVDPNFQYEAWGLGIGMGRRLYPFTDDGSRKYAMAGGIGMLIDLAGDDIYESSNFSAGCGYFFGVGLLMDFEGNDVYKAARYGLGSGAHYAMGLCIDYAGNDNYGSTGPTYNCGCSWDHSVFLFVDGGGNDVYDLQRSAGPGRGDIGSWGVGADLGGNDTYRLSSYPAGNSRDGLSAWLRSAGKSVFEFPFGSLGPPPSGHVLVNPPGGIVR